MSLIKCFIFVAIASAHLTLVAQQKPSLPDPADANAAAIPYRYVSVFDSYRPMAATALSPDKVWQSANNELGTPGGSDAGTAPSSGNAPTDHSNHQNKGK